MIYLLIELTSHEKVQGNLIFITDLTKVIVAGALKRRPRKAMCWMHYLVNKQKYVSCKHVTRLFICLNMSLINSY